MSQRSDIFANNHEIADVAIIGRELRTLQVLLEGLLNATIETPLGRHRHLTPQARDAIAGANVRLREAAAATRSRRIHLPAVRSAVQAAASVVFDPEVSTFRQQLPYLRVRFTNSDQVRFSPEEADRAITESIDRLLAATNELGHELSNAGRELRELVPAQRAAPARFRFEAGILRVLHTADQPDADVKAATRSARDGLLSCGATLLDKLGEASNCDKRIADVVLKLQEQLASEHDIVQLGIANIGSEMLCAAFADELPDALVALMQSYSAGIGMYVAQFSEWQKFAENAAAVDLSTTDVKELSTTARILTERLTVAGAVDPEVPRTFAFLSELIRDPTKASKRAVFAVVRTIENLIAAVFREGADFLSFTLDGAKEGIKSATRKVVVVTLLTVAVEAAGGIGPITSKLADAAWVQSATAIVKRQIESDAVAGGE